MILSISFYRCGRSSGVERNLAKVDVEGPNPFARSNSKPPLRWLFLYPAPFQTARSLFSTDGIRTFIISLSCCRGLRSIMKARDTDQKPDVGQLFAPIPIRPLRLKMQIWQEGPTTSERRAENAGEAWPNERSERSVGGVIPSRRIRRRFKLRLKLVFNGLDPNFHNFAQLLPRSSLNNES